MNGSRTFLPTLLCLSASIIIAACAEEPTNPKVDPPRAPRFDSGQLPIDASLAPDAAVTDSAAGGSADGGGDAGGPRRTVVGINLTPKGASPDAGAAASGETLFEEIELLALGVEATHLVVEDVDAVRESAARFSARGVSTVVSLQVVSGRRSLRDGASASWSLDDLTPALDAIFEQPLLADYLAIGSALDLYLKNAPKPERLKFRAFVTQAIVAAKAHSAKPAGLKVGFNTQLQSWLTQEEQPSLQEWANVADFVGISWLPVDANGRALSLSAAATELSEFFASAEKLKIPIVFQEVAYPSALAAGGSIASQAAFFDDVFDFVGQEVKTLSLLAVSALNDPEPAACARAARDFGPQKSGAFNEAWCSIGLRDRDSTPKPAFNSVIEGLARFSSR